MKRRAALALISAAACSSPPREARLSLIDHMRWSVVEAAADPFGDRPAMVANCPAESVTAEDFGGELSLGIKTGLCPYATVAQAIATEIREGETVRARIWHFELTGPEGAETHAALRIGGRTLWEQRVTIPARSELIRVAWTAEEEIAAGETIAFHLHNHGANSWQLIEVTTGQ